MFDPNKPFLFGGGYDFSIAHQGRRRIPHIEQPEHQHAHRVGFIIVGRLLRIDDLPENGKVLLQPVAFAMDLRYRGGPCILFKRCEEIRLSFRFLPYFFSSRSPVVSVLLQCSGDHRCPTWARLSRLPFVWNWIPP
jgi:hypothetical protein